jgi:HAD superfamily hydrolase (TIGR01509 family)
MFLKTYMNKAVIFDLDGVLIDSEPLHLLAIQEVLAADGHHVSDNELISESFGRSFSCHIRELIRKLDLHRNVEDYTRLYNEVFLQLLQASSIRSRAEANWLLQELRNRGQKLGLASSSVSILVTAMLQIMGYSDTFDVVVSGDMVTNSKPNPEIFLLTARLFGLEPCECVVIEDAPRGIEAARGAGMTNVGLITSQVPRTSLNHADYLIDTLADFPFRILG